MSKRPRKNQSKQNRKQARQIKIERQQSRKYLISTGMALISLLISARSCQYDALNYELALRQSQKGDQIIKESRIGIPKAPSGLRMLNLK